MDFVVQDQAAGRRAALSRRPEGAPQHPVQRQVEIGVIHHDHGVLAAHLERQALVHPATGRADDRSGFRGPGERDDRDVGMIDHGAPHHRALPVHQLDHLGRQPRLEQDLHQQVTRMRHILGRLEDDGVPALVCGKHLPGRDRHREIERGDDPRHADRAPVGHRPLVAQLRGHHAAEQPPAFTRRVKRRVDAFLHITPRLRQDLPHLPGHGPRDRFLLLDQQISHALQNRPTQRRRRLGPLGKAALRGGDRPLRILRTGPGEAPDQVVPVGGIAVLEVVAAGGRDPLAGNEVLEILGHFYTRLIADS